MCKLSYLFFAILFNSSWLFAQKTDLPYPSGSQRFGSSIVDLPNGNFVVTDPYYDDGEVKDVGAVFVFNGLDYTLLATIKGSHTNDRVGHEELMVLPSGNFLIKSNYWNNDTGALTWVNAEHPNNSIVSESNSLIGGTTNTISILPNGNFVVSNPTWNEGRGAVSLGEKDTGISGIITYHNSFVGNDPSDFVGQSITVLPSSNYVITSRMAEWGGAVTLANGTIGLSGRVNIANSLVGSSAYDMVGSGGITILTNGNFVISSPNWRKNGYSGAITWASGTIAISGEIFGANSLVHKGTSVPSSKIIVLQNGNYLVSSGSWESNPWAITWGDGAFGVLGIVGEWNSLVGDIASGDDVAVNIKTLKNGNYVVSCSTCLQGRGAVTFGNGTLGTFGKISELNSLVGERDGDFVGEGRVTELANGNYVISSYRWNMERGAATLVDGTKGIIGKVSASNSLIGVDPGDVISIGGIVPLKNGNYVVQSEVWRNRTGAVTWVDGTLGLTGEISDANSLIGAKDGDFIGMSGVFELTNGNFVVCSGNYDDDKGAVTLVNGQTGAVGVVDSGNSLVGGSDISGFGLWGATALTNGNYLISSSNNQTGALMWRNGSMNTSGTAELSQMLRGSQPGDQIGNPVNKGIVALPNGNFVAVSYSWNGFRGAVTWGNGETGLSGVVGSDNSLIGSTDGDQVGINKIKVLDNGNYLVLSAPWNEWRGAITWGSGKRGVAGILSSENSLVGKTAFDDIGQDEISILPDGNYTFTSYRWQGSNAAVTLGNGSSPLIGQLSSCNSLVGGQAIQPDLLKVCYNSARRYLIVGRASENQVSIYKQENKELAGENLQTETILNGSNNVPFIAETDCKIIASLTSSGSDPVEGNVTARVWIESSIPMFGTKPFLARHYEITPAQNASNATGRITLYFRQEEFDDFNAHPESFSNLPASPDDISGKMNLRISQYHGISSDGSGLPSSFSSEEFVIDPEDQDIVWNTLMSRWEISFDVTGFSNFLIHTSVPSLPVTMIDFAGKLVETNVLLNWHTTMEVNSHEFEIQRSLDGKNFSKIGSLAAYNTPGMNNYSFGDSTALFLGAQNVYYRLKIVDIDGSFSYSKKIAVTVKNDDVVTVYPNPSGNSVVVRLNGVNESRVELRIFTVDGKLLESKFVSVSTADNSATIDVSGYPAGVYQLDIRSGQAKWGSRFVKM